MSLVPEVMVDAELTELLKDLQFWKEDLPYPENLMVSNHFPHMHNYLNFNIIYLHNWFLCESL